MWNAREMGSVRSEGKRAKNVVTCLYGLRVGRKKEGRKRGKGKSNDSL